jgi:hypothetical protein
MVQILDEYPFVYFPKIAKKVCGSIFFGTMNDGNAHSDSCSPQITQSLYLCPKRRQFLENVDLTRASALERKHGCRRNLEMKSMSYFK